MFLKVTGKHMYGILKRLCASSKIDRDEVAAFLYGVILFSRNKHMSAMGTRNGLFLKHSGTSAEVSIC